MRITTKFIGSSAILIGLTALLSGSSYWMDRQAARSLDERYALTQNMNNSVVQLQMSLQRQITALSRLTVLRDDVGQIGVYKQSRRNFFEALDSLETLIPESDKAAHLKLDGIRQQHRYLETVAERMQTPQQTTLNLESQIEGTIRALKLFESNTETYINALTEDADAQIVAYGEEQQVLYIRSAWIEVLTCLSVMLLLAAQFYYLLRPIMRSLQTLEASANQIGGQALAIEGGKQTAAVPRLPKVHLDTDDELQAVADAFNEMGDRLTQSYRELERRVVERTASLNRANQDLIEEVRDRTQAEAKLREAQLQLLQTEKMSSLSQLVAGVAHEINNPVSFIQGNLEPAQGYMNSLLSLLQSYEAECPNASDELQAAIEEADLAFIQKDFPLLLKSMKTGANRITTIVRSLRTFSHLDESETKTTDIHEDIDSVLVLLAPKVSGYPTSQNERSTGRSIEIIRRYSNLPRIYCYPGQLNQVFMGLLTNAIEALANSEVDEPTITIATEAVGDRVRIQISDNGVGMSDRVRSHLFEPFFTTKKVGAGMGMGLAMSYQIVVSNHKGTLTCESEVSKGTIFTIEIPLTLKLQSAQSLSPQPLNPQHRPLNLINV